MKHTCSASTSPTASRRHREVLERVDARARRADEEIEGRRRVGVRRRAAPAEHGHRRAPQGRRRARRPTARSPKARSTSAASLIIKAPDLDAALEWGAQARARSITPPDRGPAVPGRPLSRTWLHSRPPRSSACSARSTAARWPSWSATSATSTSPRRRSRTRSPRRVRALAVDGPAAEPGGLDHHHRPQPRHRPPPPGGVARGPARAGRAAARRRDEPAEEGPVHDDRLRLIFTCCHPALATERRRSR